MRRLSFDMSGMAKDLFAYLNKKGNEESIFFLGTKQEILEATIKQFQKNYPRMNIVGYRNGYFVDSAIKMMLFLVLYNPNVTSPSLVWGPLCRSNLP